MYISLTWVFFSTVSALFYQHICNLGFSFSFLPLAQNSGVLPAGGGRRLTWSLQAVISSACGSTGLCCTGLTSAALVRRRRAFVLWGRVLYELCAVSWGGRRCRAVLLTRRRAPLLRIWAPAPQTISFDRARRLIYAAAPAPLPLSRTSFLSWVKSSSTFVISGR